MKQIKLLKVLFYFLPILIFLIILTPNTAHGGDQTCWIEWAKFQYQFGISKTYRGWTDYLPLYHYVLNVYGKMCGSIDEIQLNIKCLKYITYIFELGSTIILFYVLNNKFKDYYKSLFYSLFYFLNIAVLYNSAVWGQVDGNMTFFVFSSIIAAYYNKNYLAFVLFVLGLNMKLQTIFFLPLLMYVVALNFEKKSLLNLVIGLVLAVLTQLLIIAPFYMNGDLHKLWHVIVNSNGKYPAITMNAYNIWAILVDHKDFFKSDNEVFLGFSYHIWGLIYFFFSAFVVLIIPFIRSLKALFKKEKMIVSLNEILLIGALIPLIFFFFNTQMHERYSHPALIFITTYSLLNNKKIVLIISTFAYFQNLEGVSHLLSFNNCHTLIFTPWFIATLYLITIILLLFELFKLQKELLKPN